MPETARKTTQEIVDDRLTDLVVLSTVSLAVDNRDTPDNIFPYIEAPMSTLTGLNGTLAYARFNPNSWQRRRNPATNETLYNIDLPEWGMAESIQHAMIGNRNHIDTSLRAVPPVYPAVWFRSTKWSGMVYQILEPVEDEEAEETEEEEKKPSPIPEMEGRQVKFTVYVDDPAKVIDLRYGSELFY